MSSCTLLAVGGIKLCRILLCQANLHLT